MFGFIRTLLLTFYLSFPHRDTGTLWLSNIIEERFSNNKLKDVTGSVYILVGNMDTKNLSGKPRNNIYVFHKFKTARLPMLNMILWTNFLLAVCCLCSFADELPWSPLVEKFVCGFPQNWKMHYNKFLLASRE